MVRFSPAVIRGDHGHAAQWVQWAKNVIRQRSRFTWFRVFHSRPASGVEVRAVRLNKTYWRISVSVSGQVLNYEFWASSINADATFGFIGNTSPYSIIADRYSRAWQLVSESDSILEGALTRIGNDAQSSGIAREQFPDSTTGAELSPNDLITDSNLPEIIWQLKRPMLTWWQNNDVASPVYSEPGAYTILSGIGMGTGVTQRRTDSIYGLRGFDRVVVGERIFGVTPSDPDSELRAAAVQAVDGVTFLIISDHRGRLLVTPLPETSQFINRADMVVVEPVFPAWLNTTFFINYRFNSTGTRAVFCGYESELFFPDNIYNSVNGWLAPDADAMIVDTILSNVYPALDQSELPAPQQHHPGVFELAIDITVDGDDFSVATTISHEIAPSDSRWIVCADYAFPTVSAVDEDALIVCELVINCDTPNITASSNRGYEYTHAILTPEGSAYRKFSPHLEFSAIEGDTVFTLPLADQLADVKDADYSPTRQSEHGIPVSEEFGLFKGDNIAFLLETPLLEFPQGAPDGFDPPNMAGLRIVDSIDCRSLSIASRLTEMRKFYAKEVFPEGDGDDFFFGFAPTRITNELWINGSRVVAQAGGDFEPYTLDFERPQYVVNSQSNQYLYMYWMHRLIQTSSETQITARPNGDIACCAFSSVSMTFDERNPEAFIEFKGGPILPVYDPPQQIQGVDAITVNGEFVTTHLNAFNAAFGTDLNYQDWQTYNDPGRVANGYITRHGNPAVTGYFYG